MATTAGDDLLSVSEVAALVGAPERTVRNWALTGKLRSYPTPGGRHRFRREDVEQWIVPKEGVA